MPNKLKQHSICLVTSALFAMIFIGNTQAQVLDSTVTRQAKINSESASSQKRVTSLAQQTADLLAEYRAVVRETESLKIYNDQLEKVVMDQRAEVVSINNQLEGLEATNRGVVPMMLEMIETLGLIVEGDMPFRLEERKARVDRLRHNLGKVPAHHGSLPGGIGVWPNHGILF